MGESLVGTCLLRSLLYCMAALKGRVNLNTILKSSLSLGGSGKPGLSCILQPGYVLDQGYDALIGDIVTSEGDEP